MWLNKSRRICALSIFLLPVNVYHGTGSRGVVKVVITPNDKVDECDVYKLCILRKAHVQSIILTSAKVRPLNYTRGSWVEPPQTGLFIRIRHMELIYKKQKQLR